MLDVSSDDVSGELKMVLMVRTDLKMAKGKIAAQVIFRLHSFFLKYGS